MSKNDCTPANIYGPIERFLFCGLSVMSFSAQAGWKDQQSEVTVRLAYDDCEGQNRTYWDANLNKLTTNVDPGFTFPSIGAPAMFRVGEFEFCGLIQNWKKISDANGQVYEVKLVDPREILANTQIIVGEYAGRVDPVFNLINAYGYMELYGIPCPFEPINGFDFGTLGGGFGGAKVNENGIQWNRLKEAIHLLTSSIPTHTSFFHFSPYGRLIFRGARNNTIPSEQGYGVLAHDGENDDLGAIPNHHKFINHYFLDLSEIPNSSDFWRIKGPVISVLDIVEQVCTEAGCDYYIELIPIKIAVEGQNSSVMKIIKVRVVSRVGQPVIGAIEAFIGSQANVIESGVGQEMRVEDTTSFLIGGNVQGIYQAFDGVDNAIIEPFWGLDSAGNIVQATLDGNNEYVIPVDYTSLNSQLFSPFSSPTGEITEAELRASLAGFDEWASYALYIPTKMGQQITTDRGIAKHIFDPQQIQPLLANLVNLKNRINPRWLTSRSDIWRLDDPIIKDMEIIYEWVQNYAREYYGKKFQVLLPKTCASQDVLDSDEWLTTEEPATDGGWTEFPTVLGLVHPTFTSLFNVAPDDNKLGPFCRFDNATGLSYPNTNDEDTLFVSNTMFVKATIEDRFVYKNVLTHSGVRAIINLQAPVTLRDAQGDDVHRVIGLLREMLEKKAIGDQNDAKQLLDNVGNMNLLYDFHPRPVTPDAAAVPLKSNVQTYGPWYSAGPPGGVNIQQDPGMVPWQYGTLANLTLAGFAKVNSAKTNMTFGEYGSITVPGYPTLPLGAEIGATAALGGKHLFENRIISPTVFTEGVDPITYYFFTYLVFQGTNGPNVTNINVEVGPQGIQTTYNMRTFSPQFGRFAKSNIERLRLLGQQRLQNLKNIKLSRILQARANTAFRRAERKIPSNRGSRNSPIDLIVGQKLTFPRNIEAADNDFRSDTVEGLSYYEQHAEFSNYNVKAVMSWDGLLRPVSRSGDGGLPQYITPTGDQCVLIPHKSEDPSPPINAYVQAIINKSYLDPVLGPSDPKHGTSVGHDIDVLAQGSGVPTSGLSITTTQNYSGDARFFAMRGPILMQGWGFDLDGKPVPNSADSEANAQVGLFKDVDLTDNFFPDWLRRSHMWPVAPIDLRLDRKRGVWTIPSSFRIIQVKADEDIEHNQQGNARPQNLPPMYNAAGAEVTGTVTVTNPFTKIEKNALFNVYFDTEDCTYYPTHGCSGEPTGVQVVQDITCVDNDLIVSYITLNFSCGLFQGTTF